MIPVPKEARFVHQNYLSYIRSQPGCLVPLCAQKPDAHHIETRGAGGSDLYAVNCCRLHHTEMHRIGLSRFQARYNVNVWEEVAGLLSRWIESKASSIQAEADRLTAVWSDKVELAYTIGFPMPMPPNRANEHGGWRTRCFGKESYIESCWPYLASLRSVLKGRELPWPKVYWTAHFEVKRLYDADNLVSLAKWPLDALVQEGFLTDDGPMFCWPKMFPTQVVKAKKTDIRELFLTVDVIKAGNHGAGVLRPLCCRISRR